ncbi:hypothetical protein SDJN03_25209, partial [Cucurbita argyrosperma subsp. sororia]
MLTEALNLDLTAKSVGADSLTEKLRNEATRFLGLTLLGDSLIGPKVVGLPDEHAKRVEQLLDKTMTVQQ